MRRTCLLSLVLALAVPAGAAAQLPEPPPAPTVPLPAPSLPPLPLPPLPAPPPVQPTAPVPAPTAPAVPAPATAPVSGTPSSEPRSSQTSAPAATRPSRRAERPRRTIVLGFEAALSGRVRIAITQVAPVCREAGRLVVDARRGRNRIEFAGRVGGRRLRDGTYVADTPSGEIRFAIVRGRPTRERARLAASTCGSGVLGTFATEVAGPSESERAGAQRRASEPVAPEREIRDPIASVLGTSATRAAEAALSLHPLFYLLLALAIVTLAAASAPARVVPQPTLGALLARRRAELTMLGTVALLAVIVSYWVALVSS